MQNIIKLHEVLDTPNAIMLVMEYADGGELFEYIARKARLTEAEACSFLHQIVAGVEYCHRKRILHRDLKLENILMNRDGTISTCHDHRRRCRWVGGSVGGCVCVCVRLVVRLF